MFPTLRTTLALVSVLAMTLSLPAQPWGLEAKMAAADAEANDNLGVSTAISGDWLIAGAWWEEGDTDEQPPVNSAGSAYLFRRQSDGSWLQTQKLASGHPEILGYYGFAVAMAGPYAMVGAYNEDHSGLNNNGRVYVYTRGADDRWSATDTLTAPDTYQAEYFGHAVAMTEDYALVGAYEHQTDADGQNPLSASGAAYLFQRRPDNQWAFLRKFVAPDRAQDDWFGNEVAISDRGILIGAPAKDIGLLRSAGAAYVAYCDEPDCSLADLTRDDLVQLQPADAGNFDGFGNGLGIDGEWLVVGKPSESRLADGTTVNNAGAVYFFRRENGAWVEKQKVYAAHPQNGAFFGRQVDLDGRVCAIGAGREGLDPAGLNPVPRSGAAYLYEYLDGWQLAQKIVGTQRGPDDQFAENGLAIDSLQIVVGAWMADSLPGGESILNAGTVYVFIRDGDLPSSTRQPELRAADIRLWPNPSAGPLSLHDQTGTVGPARIRLFDARGRCVWSAQATLNPTWTADLSHLPPGLYIVQVHAITQGTVRSWRWVKR